MRYSKYKVDKVIIKNILSASTTVPRDENILIFERVWNDFVQKRGDRRTKAQKKLQNIVANLVNSIHSYDKAIRETEEALEDEKKTVHRPKSFNDYKITGEPTTIPEEDYRIILYEDLKKESKQRGPRGVEAKQKIKNMIHKLFYYVNCRKETLGWHTEILKS